jgi:hypothetical protein
LNEIVAAIKNATDCIRTAHHDPSFVQLTATQLNHDIKHRLTAPLCCVRVHWALGVRFGSLIVESNCLTVAD